MSDSAFRPGSDEEWERLLGQLRLQPKAQPQPFFYARVRSRLATQLQPTTSWLAGWLRRPAYVALLGALVLAMSKDGAALHSATAANPYGTFQPNRPIPLVPR